MIPISTEFAIREAVRSATEQLTKEDEMKRYMVQVKQGDAWVDLQITKTKPEADKIAQQYSELSARVVTVCR